MTTTQQLHIYSNETGKQVATIEGADNAECERLADAEYGSNDYRWAYCSETGAQQITTADLIDKWATIGGHAIGTPEWDAEVTAREASAADQQAKILSGDLIVTDAD